MVHVDSYAILIPAIGDDRGKSEGQTCSTSSNCSNRPWIKGRRRSTSRRKRPRNCGSAACSRTSTRPPVDAEELRAFIASIAPKAVDDDFDRQLPLGSRFSTSVGTGRFRCATFSHIRGPGLVLRVIPPPIRTIEELHLPRAVRELALASRGLVLVVGPSGSGKTTTLTAMVDLINSTCYQKVVTIEAPGRVLAREQEGDDHPDGGWSQRFFVRARARAGSSARPGRDRDQRPARSRGGPDGPGRGRGRPQGAGQHDGPYAIQAISRLISLIFPAEGEAAASRLAAGLEGVIAQRLAATRDGNARTAVEILRGGIVTSKAIQENRLKDLGHIMESRQGGMQSLDQHLVELHQSRAISGTEAMRLANNPEAVGEGLRTTTAGGADGDRPPSGIIDVTQSFTP